MYAIIKTGGKQYRISPGDEITVEKIDGQRGEEVIFDQVLLLASEEGYKLGSPLVEGAKVVTQIVHQEKGPKVYVFHMKRRKGYRKKTGHRQMYTRLRVKEIVG
jgi:large subunit ribosomal protein L21